MLNTTVGSLLDLIPEMMIEVSDEIDQQNIIWANRKAREEFGNIIGKKIFSIIPKEQWIIIHSKLKPYLRSPSAVSYSIDTTKIFPETADFKAVYDRFRTLGQGKENRLVIRSQDINFSSLLVWYLLNDSSVGLSSKTFAVLPAKSIQNPDSLLVENLSSFDIIYFKGIDELDPAIYREFYKLWKTFEGIIIADYSYYSFLDFDQQKIQLFHVIKDKKVDAPLLTENRKAYEFAVRYVQDGYTWLTGKTDYQNLEEIFSKVYDLDSIWNLVYG